MNKRQRVLRNKCVAFLLAGVLLFSATACGSQQEIYNSYAEPDSSASGSAVPSSVSAESQTGTGGEERELRISVKLPVETPGNPLVYGLNLIAQEFEAANPGVTVTIEPGMTLEEAYSGDSALFKAAETAYIQNLLVEMMSGTAADIIDVSNLAFNRYAASGLLCDLYTLEDWAAAFPEEEYFTNLLKAAEVEQGLFGIPFSVSPTGLWVNEEVAGLLGVDLEEMETIGASDVARMYQSAKEQELVSDTFVVDDEMVAGTLVRQELPDVLHYAEGKAEFCKEPFRLLLDEIKSMKFSRTVSSGDAYQSVSGEVKQYTSDTRLVTMAGLDQADMIYDLKGDLKAKFIPYATESGKRLFEGSLYSVFESGTQKGLAWEFMRFAITQQDADGYVTSAYGDNATQKERISAEQEYYTSRYQSGYALKKGTAQAQLEAWLGDLYEEEYAQQILSFLSKADTLNQYDPLLYEALEPILVEYFDHGMLSAEECAKQMQEKAELYLAE